MCFLIFSKWYLIADEGSDFPTSFAAISQRIPSLLIGIAAGRADEGYAYPLHHPRVVFDEDALVYGALAYAKAALCVK